MSISNRPSRDKRRFQSESGSILILSALVMVGLLGVVALAVDGSFMYSERNRMGAAADEAAKSGAFEVFHHLSTITQAQLEAHADHEVLAHGFNPVRLGGDTVVEVNRPPLSGLHTSENTYVEVYVSRPTNTFFGRVLGWTSLTPKARAVAGQSSSQSCVQTLKPPLGTSPASLSIGNTDLIMPNCNVQVGGNIEGTNNNATITSGGLSVSASSCTGTSNQCDGFGNVAYRAPPPYDQFTGQMPAIPALSGCTAAPTSGAIGGAETCYSGLAIGNNGTVTLNAGTTYFTGPITFGNNANLLGTGVTLVLANGSSITTGNSSQVALSAPTSGPYNGIAIYQPSTNSNPMNFQNHPVFNVNGAVYAPASDVSFRNGYDSTSDCVLMVVYTLNIDNGNGQFNNACLRYSGSPLMTVSLAE